MKEFFLGIYGKLLIAFLLLGALLFFMQGGPGKVTRGAEDKSEDYERIKKAIESFKVQKWNRGNFNTIRTDIERSSGVDEDNRKELARNLKSAYLVQISDSVKSSCRLDKDEKNINILDKELAALETEFTDNVKNIRVPVTDFKNLVSVMRSARSYYTQAEFQVRKYDAFNAKIKDYRLKPFVRENTYLVKKSDDVHDSLAMHQIAHKTFEKRKETENWTRCEVFKDFKFYFQACEENFAKQKNE